MGKQRKSVFCTVSANGCAHNKGIPHALRKQQVHCNRGMVFSTGSMSISEAETVGSCAVSKGAINLVNWNLVYSHTLSCDNILYLQKTPSAGEPKENIGYFKTLTKIYEFKLKYDISISCLPTCV